MKTTWIIGVITAVCLCYVLRSCAARPEERTSGNQLRPVIGPAGIGFSDGKTGNTGFRTGPCFSMGGRCQFNHQHCHGEKISGICLFPWYACCKKAAAWSVLCASHQHNSLKGCDHFSCGGFKSKRGNDQHRAVDLACDHNSVVNAPFSGSLAGPVSHIDHDGSQHDGVTLLNDVYCVHIFNIQALRSTGAVTQGEPLGHLAPLQEGFPGISPHLKLEMCDGSDPSPFLGL